MFCFVFSSSFIFCRLFVSVLLQGVILLCILLSSFLNRPIAGAPGMHSHAQLCPTLVILLDSARNMDPLGSYALRSDFLNHVSLYVTTENFLSFSPSHYEHSKKVAVYMCKRTYLSILSLVMSAQHYIIELSVSECPWDPQWPLYVSLKNCQLNSGLMQSPI